MSSPLWRQVKHRRTALQLFVQAKGPSLVDQAAHRALAVVKVAERAGPRRAIDNTGGGEPAGHAFHTEIALLEGAGRADFQAGALAAVHAEQGQRYAAYVGERPVLPFDDSRPYCTRARAVL